MTFGLIQQTKTKRFVKWFMDMVKQATPEFEDWDEFWDGYRNYIMNSRAAGKTRTKREFCDLFCSKDLVMMYYQTWTLERCLKRIGVIPEEGV